jgi:hypothetical protein
MDTQTKDWKAAADRLWAQPDLDYRASATLLVEMARSHDAALSAAAAQAVPSMRAALLKGAERRARDVAQRRFGAVRDVLHTVTARRFGKRGSTSEVENPNDRNRRSMLGLPMGRRLFGPEIQQAYKRAAKIMHPDGGGSERAFQELSAARDALLKDI